VWLESTPGEGSTFHFTARFARAEAGHERADGAQALAPAAGSAPRSVRVLLAEDNVVNQRVAVGLLRRRGHVVTVVDNGLDAIEALERGPFDLVLMDVQMPMMGGFDATVEIRRREHAQGHHTRIIAMTAHAMSGDRERCLAAGMDDYLSKPIDPARLYALVERTPTASAPADADEEATTFDQAALLRRLGGDKALLGDVVRLFLEDCPDRLAAITAALDGGDTERLRAAAHALKGAAGTLSATRLSAIARTIETLAADGQAAAARAECDALVAEAARVMDRIRTLTPAVSQESAPCAHS
jgi:CheY-like chemotaxis protein